MRFTENGPSIPDELLLARDQGRVVFFCGAGVSRADAKLPDFYGLAESVIASLGASFDSPARKVLEHANKAEKETNVSGLISADRVFGLLEREFDARDIQTAVAQALKPGADVNLNAHNILLDLATTRQGKVLLVTTNFDRLFDACGRNLIAWNPPRLPDPYRPSEMDGIIYLHGMATEDYQRADGDGFVLSSSGFGRAYLSEGWATSFIRKILDKHVVVFIGYAADDPPVQYLLEALNSSTGSLKGVYAFQSGGADDANSKWRHKGVEAIPFNGYSELWETLGCWAERARDPDKWQADIITKAKEGPERMLPHERGQVAHIVSTVEGVRKFSEGDAVPPAEWLCVFDPYIRYAAPDHMGDFYNRGPLVNPFELYCLDSDAPPITDQDGQIARSTIPPGAWSALLPNHLDKSNLEDWHVASFRGGFPSAAPRLASRLSQLGFWLAKVSDQSAAVWWAARQQNIHPDIRNSIQQEVNHSTRQSLPDVRTAWRYLFETWEQGRDQFDRDWFELEAEIKKEGWNSSVVRKYESCTRPYLEANISRSFRPKPPAHDEKVGLNDLLRIDVKYPDMDTIIIIPDEWLVSVVEAQRKNLEVALRLEMETGMGEYHLHDICPIVPEESSDVDEYKRSHGLSGRVIGFSKLFDQLVEFDPESAQREFSRWLNNDSTIFTRLRVWAASNPKIVSDHLAGDVILSLSDEDFWSSHQTRDLLLTLKSRWHDLDSETRSGIEKKLLAGRPQWENEDDEDYKVRSAWNSLNRIHWLADNECKMELDIDAETERLKADAPDWEKVFSSKAAESMEGRSGFVRTIEEYSDLMDIPLEAVLPKAKEISENQEDFLERKAPFAGLSAKEPDRAFAVLVASPTEQEFPEWAWVTFLNSGARKEDSNELIAAIAKHLIQLSDEVFSKIITPISDWLWNISNSLSKNQSETFDLLLDKLIKNLAADPELGRSGLRINGKVADWASQAINSPAGKIAEALFNDPCIDGLKVNDGFNPEWLEHIQKLLALPDDLHRHALAIFTYRLSWFYFIDSAWAEEKLLRVLDEQDQDDRDAFWSGFFWRNDIPGPDLFMRLKPYLLKLAIERNVMNGDRASSLPAFVLAGWGVVKQDEEQCISNVEMRDVLLQASDEFRSRFLWQLEQWSTDSKWFPLMLEMLRDVWPRQMAAKSSRVSERLCNLAFSQDESFESVATLVLPLLTTIENEYIRLPSLRRNKDTIVDLHPRLTFYLLCEVLSEDVSKWPYEIGDIFKRISEADPSIRGDEKFIELMRKWSSR